MPAVDPVRIADLSTLSLLSARTLRVFTLTESGADRGPNSRQRLQSAILFIDSALTGFSHLSHPRVAQSTVQALSCYESATRALATAAQTPPPSDLDAARQLLCRISAACKALLEEQAIDATDMQLAKSFFSALSAFAYNEHVSCIQGHSEEPLWMTRSV